MAACSMFLFVIVAILGLVVQSAADNPCILQPKKTGQQNVVVILIPAARMKPTQYLPLAHALQDSASSLSLWVAIAGFDKGIAEKSTIEEAVNNTLSVMKSKGLTPSYSLFLAAHSQNSSGSILQDYLAGKNNLAEKVSGLFLLGSFLKRSYQSSSFPVPTLTIGAELDGVCRLTRIMEAYVHIALQTGVTSMVAVVAGMTHLQFASGSPSAFIEEYDLKPERSDAEVLNSTSCIISNYISWILFKSQSSMDALNNAIIATQSLLDPLIKAYSMEGSYKFKPPCYENKPSAACQVGSSWTVVAMKALAALKTGNFVDSDSFHPADEVIPTYHHPKITSHQCPSPSLSCTVNTTSVTDNIYYKDSEDLGLVPTSACEMRAKLKSRQSILISAGFKNVDLNATDGGSWCKMLNELAYNLTLENFTSSQTRARFEKYGSPMEMGEDLGCLHNGGLWIYLPMKYSWKETNSGPGVLVLRSVQLTTDETYPIGIFAGMHYCKLLSPARVAEWVYVDGLRERYSLSGKRIHMPVCEEW